MSEHAAKGLRRDIRRAVGPEAVAVLAQHTAAIDQILPHLDQLTRLVADLERRVDSLTTRIGTTQDVCGKRLTLITDLCGEIDHLKPRLVRLEESVRAKIRRYVTGT